MIIAIVIGVSCLFWIIAAILFVCAKGVDRRISESKKDCVEKTTATVVDVEEVYKRNVDTYNYAWYPAYEFYVNGERVVQKSVIGTGKNSVQTYSGFPLELAFGVNEHPTIQDFEDFLESRCFPRTRDMMKLHLRELGLDYYDPYEICKKTHGRLEGDYYSIEFA